MAKKLKKEETKKVEKVEKKEQSLKEIIFDKKNRKYVYGIGAALLIIIIILIVVLVVNKKDDDGDKPGKEENTKVIVSDENTIKEEYGFSKEDAIAVVKESYNSDNYEFSAKAREDNKYIVTVKNTETGSTYQYVVDPNDGSYSTLEN